MTPYPQSYHAALNHLIHHGAWKNRPAGRAKVAKALMDLRRMSPAWAVRERRHMLLIAGCFPAK